MSGDYASSIAKIFNNSSAKYQEASEFYGDWLLSPNLKIADLPFFSISNHLVNNQANTTPLLHRKVQLDFAKVFTPKPNAELLLDVDEQLLTKLNEHKQKTIEQYMLEHFSAKPVTGDEVWLDDNWSLIVRDIDDKGRLRGIGLKNHKHKKE